MSKFAPRSTVTKPDQSDMVPFAEAVQQDLMSVARVVNAAKVQYLTGVDRIVCPTYGSAQLFVVTDTATAGSTGLAYHAIVGKRSGQAEGEVSIDTQNAEMAANALYYIGKYNVGPGDLLSYTLTVTGAPAPTLTTANLSLLCIFTPTDTVA